MKKRLMKIWCYFFGHRFVSNHVGVIKCKHCNLPWEVEQQRPRY